MAFSFSVPKMDGLNSAINMTAKMLREHNGSFVGDDKSGIFKGFGIEGCYSIGNDVNITITKKPFYVTESTIRKIVSRYFKTTMS